MSIHFETTTIVHCLLLLLELAHLRANGIALWDRTVRVLALLGMNSKQRPNALANLAATKDLDTTSVGVLEIILHLGTIC